jgi:hypothetical protein
VVPVGTVNNSGVNGPVDYNVTTISEALVALNTGWGTGQTLKFRWVDDNAVNISPDQVIGLNNVSINPVPIPGAIYLLGSCLAALGVRRKRANPSQPDRQGRS